MPYEKTYIQELVNKLKHQKDPEQFLNTEWISFKERLLTLEESRKKMALGFQMALEGLQQAYPQIDLEEANFIGTSDRMARAFLEMCSGLGVKDAEVFSQAFPIGEYEEMIVLKDIEYTSLCNHHFFPFVGKAHIGYIPKPPKGKGGKSVVVGLSKLARIVDVHARRPQLQERMCTDILNAIETYLQPAGTIIQLEGRHSCMGCRGPLKPEATMVTTSAHGHFLTNNHLRSEFLAVVNHRGNH